MLKYTQSHLNTHKHTLGDAMTTINFRAEIEDYTNRVLGVVKARYGLKDRAEALDYFANQYGEEYVQHEVKEEIVAEVLEQSKNYHKKIGSFKKLTAKELDKLCGTV